MLRVVDGDTVELKGLGPVRLIGIDAPESRPNPRASGPEEIRLGLQARAFLERLLKGKRVWVELDLQERDRYRRVLAYLYLEDPQGDWTHGGGRYRQVNLEMVRAGWAEPYTVPPNVRYAEPYLQASREARARGLGMWGRPSRPPGRGEGRCDPAYPAVCIPPPPPDLDCGDTPHRRFPVLPPTPRL